MITIRFKMILALLLFGVSICVLVSISRTQPVHGSAPSAFQPDLREDPLGKLNRAAKAAKGTDSVAIAEVADEVFTAFALPDLPLYTQENAKDRIRRAEMSYRQGGNSIAEKDVAKTVNELLDKLDLRDYGKVSRPMVRMVRVNLMLRLPNLIAQDPPGKRRKQKQIGSTINPAMSPLEATAVTLFLLQQKMLSDSYRVPYTQFFSNVHRKRMDRWQELRDRKDGIKPAEAQAELDQGPKLRLGPGADRESEVIKKRAAVMNSNDLLALADNSLDTLGISR